MDAQGGKLTKSLHALECNVAGIVDRVAESGDATNKRMYIILSSASAPALKLSPIAEYATLSLSFLGAIHVNLTRASAVEEPRRSC